MGSREMADGKAEHEGRSPEMGKIRPMAWKQVGRMEAGGRTSTFSMKGADPSSSSSAQGTTKDQKISGRF